MMKKILLILFVCVILNGCDTGHKGCEGSEHICMPIVYRCNWDNKEAITFSTPDGSIKASFKLEDLKKLEMWLYDGGLQYTEKLKNHKSWLHLYEGKRVILNKEE